MASRSPWPGNVVDGEIADATDFNSIPGGWLGYVSTTTNQTGITTEVDLTSLSVTVTVPGERMLEITAKVPVSSATANDRVGLRILEGATPYGAVATTATSVNLPYTLTAVAIIDNPSAGSHTYKLAAGLGGGSTGPMRTDHAGGGISLLVVKDIGPATGA